MKKVTLTTILLLLLTTISVLAQEKVNNKKELRVLTITFEEDAMTSTKNTIEEKVIEFTEENSVSVLTKHNIIKSSSRKSRMKNVVNFLKNPEKRKVSNIILC